MAVEGRFEEVVAFARLVENEIQDDQPGAGADEAVERGRIDRPRPGETFGHACELGSLLEILREKMVERDRALVDREEDDVAGVVRAQVPGDHVIARQPFRIADHVERRENEPPELRHREADARQLDEAAAGAFAGGGGHGQMLCLVRRPGRRDHLNLRLTNSKSLVHYYRPCLDGFFR